MDGTAEVLNVIFIIILIILILWLFWQVWKMWKNKMMSPSMMMGSGYGSNWKGNGYSGKNWKGGNYNKHYKKKKCCGGRQKWASS